MIQTEVVAESQLSRRDLAPYDAVVLCNIAQFTEAEVTALDDYLKQGGGVVVFGGDQVVAENYNRLLYADGKGLLPAAIGPTRRRRRPRRRRRSASTRSTSGTRSSTQFAGESDPVDGGPDRDAKTWQFHKLKLPPRTRRRKVALAFDNGDPAVDRDRRGTGGR